MGLYNEVALQLKAQPKAWLITGVAGFIGSNVLEALLKLDQTVVGVDNFSTGYQGNLDDVEAIVTPAQWSRFRFFEGDIRDLETCRAVCKDIDYVLHQAALGSVPRSINDRVTTNSVNIDGFLNMMVAARDASVERFVYAASSSTYGDHPALPKTESIIGRPLSPYAVTKYVNELYADVFFNSYGFRSVGLRYFNVFGRRQDPSGAYAAVIPRWINAMINADEIFINGDGETSRDFCFIDNAVQANILAAVRAKKGASVYNIACGERTSLNELFDLIKMELEKRGVLYANEKNYREFRKGDVKHSLANISLAEADLGYKPLCTAKEGLAATVDWFVARRSK